jgi:hypothetical protein
MYMCPIPNGFRDRAILLYTIQYTRHRTDEQHAMSSQELRIDVDGGIFENVLY